MATETEPADTQEQALGNAEQHVEAALKALIDGWPWRLINRPRRINETIGRLLDSSLALRLEREERETIV